MGTVTRRPHCPLDIHTVNMKFMILSCLVAITLGVKLENLEKPIAILRSESYLDGGNFNYNFESEDGIQVAADGSSNAEGASVMSGTYSFTLPDGTPASFNWVADQNGFRIESPLLPVAPQPEHHMPEHALEQVRFAVQQRAAGLRYDGATSQWI